MDFNSMRLIKILALVSLIGGCASAPVDTEIGIPPRPHLQLTAEDQAEIRPEVLARIWADYSALKDHIKKLEGRIQRHDEAL